MRKLINYLVITMGILMVNSLEAQKYGFVDTQKLIQNFPEVKEANSNIEIYKNQLEKKGQQMVESLQAKSKALEKKQVQGEISRKELEDEAQKLQAEENKLIAFEQESQNKILAKSQELLDPIRERIQSAIDAVATEKGYAYIFDFSTGFVLYADKSTDVTTLVKGKLGM